MSFSLACGGRLAEFGSANQARVPAGRPAGGEWTSGGAAAADPFQAFRKAGPAQGSLFGEKPSDLKPTDPNDWALRELSAVQKRDLSSCDLPQEDRRWAGAYIFHNPTSTRIKPPPTAPTSS